MVKRFLILLVAVSLVVADAGPDAVSEPEASPDPHGYYPYYSYLHAPHKKHHPTHEPEIPACAANITKTWCLEDSEYPDHAIKHAISYHHYAVLSLYKDVAANTENSVDGLSTLEEESYLCSAETSYIQPLRAVNTKGKWRTIINNIEVHYKTLTQFARIEECLTAGEACPLVPACYETKCLQKSAYHRFLVYNPYDHYFPFAVETFKLPASCACLMGSFSL